MQNPYLSLRGRLTKRFEYDSFLRSWQGAASLSGAFCFFLGLILFANYGIAKNEDPLRSTELKELKQKLQATPSDDTVKQRIRELDLRLREKYFRHLEGTRLGTYLLLGGVTMFLISVGQTSRAKLPVPKSTFEIAGSNRALAGKARSSVIITGAAIAISLMILSLGRGRTYPDKPEEIGKMLSGKSSNSSDASESATPKEMEANWPHFLGPNGNGFSPVVTPPTNWDAKTGQGIAWKVAVPSQGYNSPIVWDERVFIAGADFAERAVFCFDARTGRLLWRKVVGQSVPSVGNSTEAENSPATGYAAPTMATDGKRFFVIFSTGDMSALDFNGEILWSKCLGPLKNMYGHASSLLASNGRLFAQVDQGESAQGKSRLYAFDCRTGVVLWQQPRSVGSSWSSPTLIESGGRMELVTIAVPRVNAYAVDTGAELWRVEGINGEVTSSPIAAAGFVFAISPSEKLMAIRPDGSGDVTKSRVAWTSEDNVPDIASPASNGELLFTITTSGVLTCYDAKGGKKQWEHDYETEFNASPAIANNALYLFSLKGLAFVVDAGRQFKELFRTEMPDAFSASPAFAQDNIYIRGATNLWCLGPIPGQLAR
jgi:outer membrane protein assembly factor BamB